MAWGKEGWHEGKVTAILPKRFTVLFEDEDRFDISKQSTKRVCWTLEKTESVEHDRSEAMTKTIALNRAKEDKIAKKAKQKPMLHLLETAP
jgi:hypothetical protein